MFTKYYIYLYLLYIPLTVCPSADYLLKESQIIQVAGSKQPQIIQVTGRGSLISEKLYTSIANGST